MPIVHGGETFTIAPGATLSLITTWSPPNQGPVFVNADPQSGQRVPAILITFDFGKCRHAPPPGGPGGPGTHEVFYKWKVRSESSQAVTFSPEFFDPA